MRNAGGILVGTAALLSACLGGADAPDWLVERKPLPLCGEIAVTDAGTPSDAESQRCMLAAWEGHGEAERIIHAVNENTGNEMAVYQRVHRNGTVEMFLDLGGGGDGRWERLRCDSLTRVPMPARDEDLYTLDACEQLPVP